MSIDISPEHQDFVRQELARGNFASEQELIDEAIALLRSRQALRVKLQNGIDQLRRGESTAYGPHDRQQFFEDLLGRSPSEQP